MGQWMAVVVKKDNQKEVNFQGLQLALFVYERVGLLWWVRGIKLPQISFRVHVHGCRDRGSRYDGCMRDLLENLFGADQREEIIQRIQSCQW